MCADRHLQEARGDQSIGTSDEREAPNDLSEGALLGEVGSPNQKQHGIWNTSYPVAVYNNLEIVHGQNTDLIGFDLNIAHNAAVREHRGRFCFRSIRKSSAGQIRIGVVEASAGAWGSKPAELF